MSETYPKTCILCNKPITDSIYECYWDKDLKEIVYRHKDSYCQKKSDGHYAYMRRHGQTKFD